MTPAPAALQPGLFELVAPYEPAGDQPAAIDALVRGVAEGRASQVLMGVSSPSTRTVMRLSKTKHSPSQCSFPYSF